MNITFFIGNGFDLNIGLKTNYKNFLPYFLEKANDDNMIKGWISENISLWSDMERELGRKIVNVSEDKINKFCDDKEELDVLLGDYLNIQEEKIDDDNIRSMIDEFIRSLKEYSSTLPIKQRNGIDETKKAYINDDYDICFIVFNYTKIIDRLILEAKDKCIIANHTAQNGVQRKEAIKSVMHIHGSTEEEMILGVNDPGQIENDDVKNNTDIQSSMIKEYMNEGIGQNKTQIAKSIIRNSHIIIIFGMSMGDTDNLWWEQVVDWLTQNDKNRLVYYAYIENPDITRRTAGRKIIESNRIINELLSRRSLSVDVAESIRGRIYVVFQADIFKFKNIIKSNK